MKRPSKFDGETGTLAGVSASPLGPPQGEAVIPFPRSAAAALAAEGSEGAGVSSASASSTFTSLGDLTHAVVLRLAGGYPKIRVRGAAEGGGPAAPLGDQRAEGERGD